MQQYVAVYSQDHFLWKWRDRFSARALNYAMLFKRVDFDRNVCKIKGHLSVSFCYLVIGQIPYFEWQIATTMRTFCKSTLSMAVIKVW